MNIRNDIKNEILLHAEIALHYNNLLINQCNSWLSEEEGNKNIMKRILKMKMNNRKKSKLRY